MEPITYKYSKFLAIFTTAFIFVFAIFITYGAITSTGDDRMTMVVGVLVLLALLIYVCNKLFLPMLRGETILEIDDEKL